MEEIPVPANHPKHFDKKVQLTIFADADELRRSITGIIVFVNSTPVKWYFKMEYTVETSTYGSELGDAIYKHWSCDRKFTKFGVLLDSIHSIRFIRYVLR
jgi:hypothetical protein